MDERLRGRERWIFVAIIVASQITASLVRSFFVQCLPYATGPVTSQAPPHWRRGRRRVRYSKRAVAVGRMKRGQSPVKWGGGMKGLTKLIYTTEYGRKLFAENEFFSKKNRNSSQPTLLPSSLKQLSRTRRIIRRLVRRRRGTSAAVYVRKSLCS